MRRYLGHQGWNPVQLAIFVGRHRFRLARRQLRARLAWTVLRLAIASASALARLARRIDAEMVESLRS